MRNLIVIFAVMAIIASNSGIATATCPSGGGAILESISGICWRCIFPFKLAGFNVAPGVSDNDSFDNVICVCPKADCYPCFTGIGETLSYWAQNRVAETTSDPWCFPYFGLDMSSMSDGTLLGTSSISAGQTGGKTTGHGFAQMHWWKNYIWTTILDEIAGSMCDDGGEQEDEGNDIGWLTEIEPLWNDDELTAIIEPEALLFANPIAQLACIPQAISSAIGYDMPLLFWCIGGGSSYPLTGAINNPDYVEANARVTGRAIYRMTRVMVLSDTAIDACGPTTLPIWWESHYRIQQLKPVKDSTCQTLGRTSMLWSEMKNPPGKGDNFIWLLYRKSLCCFNLQCLC